MSKVVHCLEEPYDVYIGRVNRYYELPKSKWANPFSIGRDGNREEVIEKYFHYLMDQPQLLKDLPELRGKVLGCWCKPLSCHGDLLLILAEAFSEL